MTACSETHLSSLLFPLSLVLLIVSVTLPSLPLIRSFAMFFANPSSILFFLILFICFSPFFISVLLQYLFALIFSCFHVLPPSSFPLFFFSPRWNERAGFDVYKAAWCESNRAKEDYRLHLHRQTLSQHGEPTGHPRSC